MAAGKGQRPGRVISTQTRFWPIGPPLDTLPYRQCASPSAFGGGFAVCFGDRRRERREAHDPAPTSHSHACFDSAVCDGFDINARLACAQFYNPLFTAQIKQFLKVVARAARAST